ncbi:MAG: response regulator [Pseudomonadota bacterium]
METVKDGVEAAKKYGKRKDSGDPFDVVILKLTIKGGMGGDQAIKELIKIHPGVKAIIASGYAKTKEVDAAQELGAGKYIEKPYTLEKIGVAVKEELEK